MHTQRDTAVSHWYGQFLPFSVLIKTLRLLAPSSTNPMALCSLELEPNGLMQRLSYFFSTSFTHSLSPYMSVSICDCLWWMDEAKEESGECETLHHWGQWKKKRENEHGRRKEGMGICGGGVVWVCVGCCTWTAYKSTYMHSAPAFMSWLSGMQSVHVLMRVCLYFCVHTGVCARMCVQGRDRLNLYSWSVPRRD